MECENRKLFLREPLGLNYRVKAGFGQISRFFSLNNDGYSPQTIEISASNRLSLATIA